MARQPRVDTLQHSRFFDDGAAERPIVEYTVSREGRMFTEQPQDDPPPRPPLGPDMLAMGRHRFTVSCEPCHGASGYGDGMIVRHGYPAPPSYHLPRLREASDSHLYDVLIYGLGKMPPYAAHVPPAERWPVIAYIRALQLSQHASVELLGEEERARLDERPATQPSQEREQSP